MLYAGLTLGASALQAQGKHFDRAALLPQAWPIPSLAEAGSGPWMAPIASAIIPGTGQLLRGEDRGAIYLIAEAFLLHRFVSLWTDAHRNEDQYRELALRIARAAYDPEPRDTVFEYFEQMGKFSESGPFDTDPGTRLVPPTDEATYNGSIWALARRTFFSGNTIPADTSVTYQAALAFYRRRAIGPNFQWSWQGATVEQDLFRQTIRDGDETFRQATRQLGLLLANHFLSAVDAFVSQRLNARRGRIMVEHRVWTAGPTGAGMRVKVGISF